MNPEERVWDENRWRPSTNGLEQHPANDIPNSDDVRNTPFSGGHFTSQVRLEPQHHYANIFGIPRLGRIVHQPPYLAPPTTQRNLIRSWLEKAVAHPGAAADASYTVPGSQQDMILFDDIAANWLPERLHLGTWVGNELAGMLGHSLIQTSLQAWKHWMNAAPIWHPGGLVTVPCLGVRREGRFVAIRTDGFHLGNTAGAQAGRENIEGKLRNGERALVALARRIANLYSFRVIALYVRPQSEHAGYEVLSREMIGQAVREILGDKWFDLPFDVDNELRGWAVQDWEMGFMRAMA